MNDSHPERREWLADLRFGLFLHYGLFSVAARHEWVKHREKLTDGQYQPYFDHFTADRYDPEEWVAVAKRAGMRYAVLTTKHHEGFCLWDSALTTYTSVHAPAGRDIVAEFVEACRAGGLGVGLYYSLLDWHHPDFPLDRIHPQADDPAVRAEARDGSRYVEYLHGQVEELVSRFHPDVLWFDFSYPDEPDGGKGRDFWRSAELVDKIRQIDADVLLNNRLDLPGSEDFTTPENLQPSESSDQLWEACRTINDSWGYAPQLTNWLDEDQVVRLLIDSVSKGGNLLLNVGPTGRGELEPRAQRLLAEVGAWTDPHAAAIYGAGPSELTPPDGCRLTSSGERTFLHLTGGWPIERLVLPPTPRPLRYAAFLHDGAEVRFDVVPEQAAPDVPHVIAAGPPGSAVLRLPLARPDVTVPVIELDFAGAAG